MRIRTIAVTTTAALGVMLALAAPAWAHVTISAPDATRGGSDVTITFRVPTESDTASTVGLKVQLPTDTPIANVLVQATPGWTHSQKTVTLAKPVHTDDGDVTQAVSEIHWTATTAGIRPGEFGEFVVIAEQLPDTAQLTFKAIQIYSDHSQVAWIEAPAPGSTAEPEHPAPVLKLADAASGDSAAPAVTAASGTPMAATKSSSQTGAVILAGIALAVAAVAAGFGAAAFRTSRRRTR